MEIRERSHSSALDIGSWTTPDLYLGASHAPQNSRVGGPTSQQPKPLDRGVPSQSLDSHPTWSSSVSNRAQPGSDRSMKATFKGNEYHGARTTSEGKICLHTHHHHYWIMSDSAPLEKAIPRLRSSRDRMPLQPADESGRFDGQMDSWPSESEVEALAASQRPPSRDTNHRYFIEG